MEGLVDLDPRFDFDPADASPRVRDLLRGVRAERLPGITRERYAAAKQAFDAKDYGLAATRFADVRALLAEPVLEDAQAGLADLRTLADGFADLSAKLQPAAAASPFLQPPAAEAVPRAGAGPGPAPVGTSHAGDSRTTPPTTTPPPTPAAAERSQVVEPVAVSQQPPAWPPALGLLRGRAYRATVMVIIDEAGKVTSARIVESVNRVYRLAAARRRAALDVSASHATRHPHSVHEGRQRDRRGALETPIWRR